MASNYHHDKSFRQVSSLKPGEYENCTFSNCQLSKADFTGYLLADCTFTDCDLSGVRLSETAVQTVAFERCKLLGLHFEDCRDFLFAVSFKSCNLELSTFIDGKLKGTVFQDCRLYEVDFTGADMREVRLKNCDLERATFVRTDLRKSDFRTARNYQFSPEENRLRKAQFSVEGLPGLLEEYGIIVE